SQRSAHPCSQEPVSHLISYWLYIATTQTGAVCHRDRCGDGSANEIRARPKRLDQVMCGFCGLLRRALDLRHLTRPASGAANNGRCIAGKTLTDHGERAILEKCAVTPAPCELPAAGSLF